MTASFVTTVGFDSIAVALLARSQPDRHRLQRAAVRRAAVGRRADADPGGIPAELIDVLQATILFFLDRQPGRCAISG